MKFVFEFALENARNSVLELKKLSGGRNPDPPFLPKLSMRVPIAGVASSISEGDIFIYSCSAQLISFEIDCFYGL